MKLSDSSIVDVNNLGEKELNEFVLQCLSLLNNNLNDKKSIERKLQLSESFRKVSSKKRKYKIMEGFFELIYYFEEIEEYEKCAILKKVKDSLLIDL